jgi:tRNA threonylcarbamoyladenosine biosynthesis protein TsaB
LATAKGLAYESALPLVGVSTLHANAARVKHFDAVVGSMLDARKGEVYFALFRRSQNLLTRITCDAMMSIHSAIDLVRNNQGGPDATLVLIGEGAQAHKRQLIDSLGSSAQVFDGPCLPSVAAQVGMLAAERFASGSGDDVGALTPVYLRVSEAESKRKNLR